MQTHTRAHAHTNADTHTHTHTHHALSLSSCHPRLHLKPKDLRGWLHLKLSPSTPTKYSASKTNTAPIPTPWPQCSFTLPYPLPPTTHNVILPQALTFTYDLMPLGLCPQTSGGVPCGCREEGGCLQIFHRYIRICRVTRPSSVSRSPHPHGIIKPWTIWL